MADKFMNNIDIQEEKLSYQDDTSVTPPNNVFSYTESRSCSDIARMISETSLNTDPFYQRDDVWKKPEKTRFIDSLLKRLPIPSLCFSVDTNENYQVIDGKQRAKTIYELMNAINNLHKTENEFIFSELKDVDQKISGKTLTQVSIDNPEVITLLKNITLPINMLKCDYSREDNLSYIFKIFHRLNSGGVKLTNQEIRNCIYSGKFINLINELDNNPDWKIWVPTLAAQSRQKGRERILAFFAFYNNIENYKGNMTSFFNNFVEENKNPSPEWLEKHKKLFENTIKEASKINLKYQKNVYIDAILYGIASNIEIFPNRTKKVLNNKFHLLLEDESFSKENVQEGIAQTLGLKRRFAAAKQVFGE